MDRPRLGRADVRVAASVWALELIPVLVRWTARPSPGRCLRVPLPFEYVHQLGMSDDLGPNLAGRGVVADQSVLNDGDLPGRVLVAVPAHERVVDPAAFVQTAKPGGGMGGTPKLRRLPSGAGVSGGGGVVSGGRGFGCWWRRLGCRVRRRGNSAWRSAQVQAVWFQAVARNADEVLLPAAAFRGMKLRLALAQSLDAAAAVQQRAPARVQSPIQSPGPTPPSGVPASGAPTSWYGRHCWEHRTGRRRRDR